MTFALQKISKFIGMININRAKSEKLAMQPNEACKFMFATSFDVNAAVELVRNYEVQIVTVLYCDCVSLVMQDDI